jgi:hypothetical protein
MNAKSPALRWSLQLYDPISSLQVKLKLLIKKILLWSHPLIFMIIINYYNLELISENYPLIHSIKHFLQL